MARRYLFSDESGDLQFRRSPHVTRCFAVGTLLIGHQELVKLRRALAEVRDQLAWESQGLDSTFHATEDNHAVRTAVFTALGSVDFRVDVTILEKSKAQPHARTNQPRFFQYAWFYHLKYLAPRVSNAGDELQVVAAEIGTKRDRAAFRATIEDVLTQCMPFRAKRVLAFWRDEILRCRRSTTAHGRSCGVGSVVIPRNSR